MISVIFPFMSYITCLPYSTYVGFELELPDKNRIWMRIRIRVFRFLFGYDTSRYGIYNSTYKNIDIYLYIYEISLIYLYIYKNMLIYICTYKYIDIV